LGSLGKLQNKGTRDKINQLAGRGILVYYVEVCVSLCCCCDYIVNLIMLFINLLLV
jgi:hypothetical protein